MKNQDYKMIIIVLTAAIRSTSTPHDNTSRNSNTPEQHNTGERLYIHTLTADLLLV